MIMIAITFEMAYCNAKLLSWFASLPLLNVAITEFWCLSFIHIRLHSAVLFSLSMYSGLTTFDDALLGRGYFLDSLMNMKLYSLSLREDELGMVFDISKNNFSIWLHFVIKNLPINSSLNIDILLEFYQPRSTLSWWPRDPLWFKCELL